MQLEYAEVNYSTIKPNKNDKNNSIDFQSLAHGIKMLTLFPLLVISLVSVPTNFNQFINYPIFLMHLSMPYLLIDLGVLGGNITAKVLPWSIAKRFRNFILYIHCVFDYLLPLLFFFITALLLVIFAVLLVGAMIYSGITDVLKGNYTSASYGALGGSVLALLLGFALFGYIKYIRNLFSREYYVFILNIHDIMVGNNRYRPINLSN
ncbi:hypothetical protein TI04_10255 [Achromatium sp. WMS2]|nr:hypothetical protein TI04_10255 [Achromatium sp. WMS2]